MSIVSEFIADHLEAMVTATYIGGGAIVAFLTLLWRRSSNDVKKAAEFKALKKEVHDLSEKVEKAIEKSEAEHKYIKNKMDNVVEAQARLEGYLKGKLGNETKH